jgi:hypothetical protein
MLQKTGQFLAIKYVEKCFNCIYLKNEINNGIFTNGGKKIIYLKSYKN